MVKPMGGGGTTEQEGKRRNGKKIKEYGYTAKENNNPDGQMIPTGIDA